MSKPVVLGAAWAVALVFSVPAGAITVVLAPSKDNTLYQSSTGALSNGIGSYLFAGVTAQTASLRTRRALLAFNIAASVPAGATIHAAELTLYVSKTPIAGPDFTLHRVLADWGESTSNATGEEGAGVAAATGDATWIHRFRPAQLWTTPGGDYAAIPSATFYVLDQDTSPVWSSPQMAADVQSWLNSPAGNFGWLIKSTIENLGGNAKRFNSRENTDQIGVPPRLSIVYTLPGSSGDMNCDSVVNEADTAPLVQALLDPNGYQLAYPGCNITRGDMDGDGKVNGGDISGFLDVIVP